MGLLDDVAGISGNIIDGDGKNAGLVNTLIEFFINKYGGLQGFVDNFKDNGMEDYITSWISTGANKDITSDDIIKGFGKQNFDELLNKSNFDKDTLQVKLSEILPNLIDKLTPGGEIPDKNFLEKALLIFKRSL